MGNDTQRDVSGDSGGIHVLRVELICSFNLGMVMGMIIMGGGG